MRASDREPIEIELAAGHSPESPFAPPEHGGTTGEPSPAGGPDRRVIVVAAVVAVMALALGWMLGRSASDDAGDVDPVAASTVPIASIEVADTAAPVAVASAPPVPTTAAVVTAASAPAVADEPGDEAAPVVEQVEVAVALDGVPIEIVAYGNGRRLQRLDLARGALVTQRVDRPPFGRPYLILGDGWVVLPPADPAQPAIVVGDDGEVGEATFGPILQIPGASTGLGPWVMSDELAAGGAGSIQRVPGSAGEASEVLLLPGPPSRFDPRGGFVVDAPGGSYRVDTDGATRITDGELLAIGSDVAVADECDDALMCSVVVIDRLTAGRRALAVDRPLDDSRLTSFAIAGGSSVAPDGAQAIVRVVNPATQLTSLPTLGIVDLDSGAVTEVGPVQDIDRVVWSPDARFLFFDRGGKVLAYERVTGESHVVAEELIAVETFAVRVVTDRS